MRVYLDNAATTRISEKALIAMGEIMRESWGNASSLHGMGLAAKGDVEKARKIIGTQMGVDPARVVFTSGATEANNTILRDYAIEGMNGGKRHLVVSAIEHASVWEFCQFLKRVHGFELSVIQPDATGSVCAEEVERAIRHDTAFVAVMAVNNEVGTIQPFQSIHDLCRSYGVPYHCDFTQAVGHTHIDGMDCASFSFSAHKFHGPKGAGALVLPSGWRGRPILYGGSQENGSRAGTENVEGITSMAVALCEQTNNVERSDRILILKKLLWNGLRDSIDGVVLNGNIESSVPNILNVSFDGVHGDSLVYMLSEAYGVYCSTGSACCNGNTDPSRVLKAMGMSDNQALNAVRFSLSRYTTKEEIDYTIEAVKKSVLMIRR